MPIDIAILASSIVSSFLVPYAKQGLEKIREEVTDTAGQAVASGVEKVWKRVKALFGSERDQTRWEDLEQYPEETAPTITRVLQEKLAEEPDVARELDELVNAPVPGGSGATLQSIMADTFGFVDARGAHISGGQVAGVIVGVPASDVGAHDLHAPPPSQAGSEAMGSSIGARDPRDPPTNQNR